MRKIRGRILLLTHHHGVSTKTREVDRRFQFTYSMKPERLERSTTRSRVICSQSISRIRTREMR